LHAIVQGCLVFLLLTATASATYNPLSALSANTPEPSAAPTTIAELSDDDIDASRLAIDARSAKLRLQSGPLAVAALHKTYQEVVRPEELETWENLTGKLAGILEDHSTTLLRFRNYRKATRDKLHEMQSWKGFAEKPPYSIIILDNLLDSLNAKQDTLKSLDLIRATIEGEFEERSGSLKNSSAQVRLAQENVEKQTGKPDERRSRWLLLLAQLQHEVNQAGLVYGEDRRLSVAELQKGAQADVDFLKRKLAIVRKAYRFSGEELQQKILAIDEQLQTLSLRLEQAKNREKEARKRLDAAELSLGRAQTELVAGKGSQVVLNRLLKEQERRQMQFDDASIRVLVASGISQLLKQEKVVWEERHLFASGSGAEVNLTAGKGGKLELVAKWKEYLGTKLSGLELLIKRKQAALASDSLAAADREDIRADIALFQEQKALLQDGILFISNYEQLVQRRNEEAKLSQARTSLTGHASGMLDRVTTLAGKIWNAELYVAEETIIADNKKIIRPRSVTVGKVVAAILLLLIGAWIIFHLKKPLHWLATRRLKFKTNDAQLFTRLLTYLMFIVVFVSALVFVNIPLAVFTFFGGALAIGIGFGAQTLINNFISGLILMFDRTIRMGDIVEVDGHRGRVASIGMRSSSIKRFDGVEMLVPNSVFLQQNVTNWTSADPRARYSISIGVAYGSPTREVERVICAAVEEQPEVLRDPSAYVILENFADSALNFTAYFWIELDPEVNSLVVFSDIRHRISERLAEAGIAIPFPQRDLHLEATKPIEIRMVNPG
jgi:small-conductance mechanosensitive channel